MQTKFYSITESKFIDYLLIFLIIAFSGFPFFTSNSYYILIPFIFSLYIFLNRRQKFTKGFLKVFFFLSIIIVAQIIFSNFFPVETTISFYIRFLYAYFTVKIVNENFDIIYVNILYYLTIISFVFFIPSFIFPSFEQFLITELSPLFTQTRLYSIYEYTPNIILYNINTGQGTWEFFRNSGPFWEPGAFSGFLLLALLFNIIRENKVYTKKNIIFILGILSTFSSSGYIALGSVFLTFMVLNKGLFRKIILLPSLIILFWIAYFNLTFLNEKIDYQYLAASEGDVTYTQRNRFISAYLDMQDILANPILGIGRSYEIRYSVYGGIRTDLEHRNNGITDFAVKFGLPFTILYFFLIYNSFNKLCIYTNYMRRFALLALIIVLIIGFSETYFSKPFFIALSFLGLIPPFSSSTNKK